jgi:molecular chaperone DnaK
MAIVGIDLGTWTSAVAYFRDGKPELISINGNRIIPSAVALDPVFGRVIVGHEATHEPDTCVREWKRLMGSDERLRLGDREVSQEELSAHVLRYLKEAAEDFLGEPVTEAIITVPARFNNRQRQATMDAAQMAGLPVNRLISEPVSAALAYGIDRLQADERVLVFDFGGGTLDVSIVELVQGILEVSGSTGDTQLGGKDLDQVIIDRVLSEVTQTHQLDLTSQMHKIKEEAERAKRILSKSDQTVLRLPFLGQRGGVQVGLELPIQRSEFASWIRAHIDRAMGFVDQLLAERSLRPSDIHQVILVGGSCRVPSVQSRLREKFGEAKVRTVVNLDEAVAIGAAIQVGITLGVTDLLVVDVCSYTLGVATLEEIGAGQWIPDLFSVLIPKYTAIPVTRSGIYGTVRDDQDAVDVEIYQGDSQLCRENEFVTAFHLGGIPPDPAGAQEVEVEFRYNVNHIVDVTATVLSTGEQASCSFRSPNLAPEELAQRQATVQEAWRHTALCQELAPLLQAAESRALEFPSHADAIQAMVAELQAALRSRDVGLVRRCEERLEARLIDLF